MLLILLIGIAVAGHAALWLAILNRVHALPIPCGLIHVAEKVVFLIVLGIPIAAAWAETSGEYSVRDNVLSGESLWLTAYIGSCALIWLVIVPAWLRREVFARKVRALVSNVTTRIDVVSCTEARLVAGAKARCLSWIPWNQMLEIHIQKKTIQHPALPPELCGLTIAHLSDLHFTGNICREFFEVLVDQTNELQPDLIVLTGDIIDRKKCLDWIPQILGRLKARQGAYFILGNHDKRLGDVVSIRNSVIKAGLTDVSGRWLIQNNLAAPLLLAGTEEPWFHSCPDLTGAPPARRAGGAFRVLLSHSPDQLPWARVHSFDLMLAGHTHGGQIRLPLIGPIVSPSWYGVKYASGVFHEPPTLMHVSRGVSGVDPIRINCAPELALLVLNPMR